MANGALYVMTVGTSMMPVLFVNSLALRWLQLLTDWLSMVLALVQFTTIKWPALGLRQGFLSAPTMALEFMTAVMVKMQEWLVMVSQCMSLV